MKHVYFVQILCGPKRHAIVAMTGELEDEIIFKNIDLTKGALARLAREAVESGFSDQPTKEWIALGIGKIDPLCGICGSKYENWLIEPNITKFTSLDEAMPHFRVAELEQLITRFRIDEDKAKAASN